MAEMVVSVFDLDNPFEGFKFCKKCHSTLPYSEFYLESKNKRKFEGQRRNICKCCWNKTNGKLKKDLDKVSVSLFDDIETFDITVVNNLLKRHGVYYADVKYCADKKSFYVTKDHSYNGNAVYFMVEVNGEDFIVHKVGKADGDKGLNGRFYKYAGDSNERMESCKTTKKIHEIMTTKLQGKILKIYYLPDLSPVTSHVYGREVTYGAARQLEKVLSRQCREQGHPMLLSSQD